MSWLLPVGLLGAALLLMRARPQWPLALKHQALVLWGGWLVTGGVFFSVAGFFHPYYLAILGAPLAALVGIAVGELWEMRARHPRWATLILAPAAAGTLVFQMATARAYTASIGWGTARARVGGRRRGPSRRGHAGSMAARWPRPALRWYSPRCSSLQASGPG